MNCARWREPGSGNRTKARRTVSRSFPELAFSDWECLWQASVTIPRKDWLSRKNTTYQPKVQYRDFTSAAKFKYFSRTQHQIQVLLKDFVMSTQIQVLFQDSWNSRTAREPCYTEYKCVEGQSTCSVGVLCGPVVAHLAGNPSVFFLAQV